MLEEYRNISTHAVTLASGRPLAPGDAAPADMDDPHDRALCDDGHLTKSQDQIAYDDMARDALEQLAATRELDVKGTGAGGNVLVGDLVKALEADDHKQED